MTRDQGSTHAIRTTWTARDSTAAMALLLCAGLPVVYRPTGTELVARLGLPAWSLAIAFAVYCTMVVALCAWLTGHLVGRLATIVFRAIVLAGAAAVAVLSLASVATLDQRADRDEALEIGVRRLLSGDDPWATVTQLGGHISPLVGGLLLALPFVIMGSSAIQSVVWWVVGNAAAWKRVGPQATAIAVALLLSSPVMLNELVFHSDLWVNAAILALAFLWCRRDVEESATALRLMPSALLAALAFADRFLFLVLLVPITVSLLRSERRSSALAWLAMCTGATAGLYAVMLVAFPGSIRSIIANAGSLDDVAIPHAGLLLAAATAAVALVSSLAASTTRGYLWAMALSLAAAPAGTAVLLLMGGAETTISDYRVASYGAAFLVVGVAALTWPRQANEAPAEPATPAESARQRP